jgi:hypothetical protein
LTLFAVTAANAGAGGTVLAAGDAIAPARALPQQKTKAPPLVKYVAYLDKVSGPVPPRLGGWACNRSSCTLRTTGAASQSKMLGFCRGLWRLAKDQGAANFRIYKVVAIPGMTLDSAESCSR